MNVRSLVAILIAASSTLLAQTSPVVPKPTGPFNIGTTEFALTDNTRLETLSGDPSDKREIYIRVWYPAEISDNARPLPIFGEQTKVIAEALTPAFGLPSGALDFLARTPSNSYADAMPAKSKHKFPVIVFSHGYYRGFAAQNAIQMEELASHGYAVFAIGHTYETVVNIFPGGRSVTAGKALLSQPNPESDRLQAAYKNARTPEERSDHAKQIVLLDPANQRLSVWTADVRFVLDEIERMNSGRSRSIFSGRLDTKRVGIMGMSFGGATAGQVCVKDKRCRAGINLDATQYGDVYATGLKRPFMFMASDGQGTGINRDIYDAAETDAYFLVVKGANHRNFSNLNLLKAIDRDNRILGTIPVDRMEKILNSYILAFFDKYLKDIDSPLLRGGSPRFPEVAFTAKSAK